VRDNVERHLGAFAQIAEAGLLDGRDVDENVLPAAIRLNKAIALIALNHFTVQVDMSIPTFFKPQGS
jgi:hypothetical protein